jgi:hypothetical protein
MADSESAPVRRELVTAGGRFWAEILSAHVRHLHDDPYVPVLGEQPHGRELFVMQWILRLLIDRRFPDSATAGDVTRYVRAACERAEAREREDEVNSGLQLGQIRIAEALIRSHRGEDWLMGGITEDEAGTAMGALVFDLIEGMSVADVLDLVAEAERRNEQ